MTDVICLVLLSQELLVNGFLGMKSGAHDWKEKKKKKELVIIPGSREGWLRLFTPTNLFTVWDEQVQEFAVTFLRRLKKEWFLLIQLGEAVRTYLSKVLTRCS